MLQDYRCGGISGYAKARAVYISDEIQQRLDFVVRQIGLRGTSISGNIERTLRNLLISFSGAFFEYGRMSLRLPRGMFSHIWHTIEVVRQ